MQILEIQASLLGEVAPLLSSLVELAQRMLVSHEGARSRWVGSPLVVRGRDSNRSVFTELLLHTLLEGENGP